MSIPADTDNPDQPRHDPPPTHLDQARADAWLRELWPCVPEYRPGDRPRPYTAAR